MGSRGVERHGGGRNDAELAVHTSEGVEDTFEISGVNGGELNPLARTWG